MILTREGKGVSQVATDGTFGCDSEETLMKGRLRDEGRAKELTRDAEAPGHAQQRDATPLSSLGLKGKGGEDGVLAP